jgi:hypothetical protein
MNDGIDKRTLRRRLIMRIKAAFADARYPGDESIAKENHCWECDEIAEAFKGKHWKDLTNVKFLNYHDSSLSLFKTPTFQFFLPAFLLADLKKSITIDILFHLTPPEIIDSDSDEWVKKFGYSHFDYFISKTNGFTSRQRTAIKEYLEYCCQKNTSSFDDKDYKRAIAFWSEPE